MQLPDLKALKKLTAACRKAGIKTIKIDNLELTLADYEPAPSPYKQRKATTFKGITSSKRVDDGKDEVTSDELSEDALLFWSTTAPGEEQEAKQ